MSTAVEINNLTWQYTDTEKPALRNINLKIEENSFIGLCGPNESGKTSLVSCIKGLIPNNFHGAYLGEVKLFGKDVRELNTQELAEYVGFVFADPEAQFTSMSVEEELAFGMENIGLGLDEIYRRIDWAADITMIGDLLRKSPYDISGGQKQRVAIASAIVMQPKIIIMDEPTSMLDPFGKDSVFSICERMKNDLNMTIIMVEHTIDRLTRLSDKLLLIDNGEIIKYSAPKVFFDDVQEIESYGLNVPDAMLFLDRLRKRKLYNGEMEYDLDKISNITQSILNSSHGVM